MITPCVSSPQDCPQVWELARRTHRTHVLLAVFYYSEMTQSRISAGKWGTEQSLEGTGMNFQESSSRRVARVHLI